MTVPRFTINRGQTLHFYNAPNFGLTIDKTKGEHNFITHIIGDDRSFEFASVSIDRKQAAHVLKKYRKVLAKERAKA